MWFLACCGIPTRRSGLSTWQKVVCVPPPVSHHCAGGLLSSHKKGDPCLKPHWIQLHIYMTLDKTDSIMYVINHDYDVFTVNIIGSGKFRTSSAKPIGFRATIRFCKQSLALWPNRRAAQPRQTRRSPRSARKRLLSSAA